MATTVNAAFAEFMKHTVNLDPQVTSEARASRAWLRGQLSGLHEQELSLPLPYIELDENFGSFDRRTKLRELDDVDMLVCMHAQGASYDHDSLAISSKAGTRLTGLCDPGTNTVNSRRVLNAFVRALGKIPQYARSAIGREGEAVVLDLASRTWSFDIVPAFFTTPESSGRTFYLIPDGRGGWKRTDPRIDRHRAEKAHVTHQRNALPLIRLVKYWNRRARVRTLPSYVTESMMLDYLSQPLTELTEFVDVNFCLAMADVQERVLGPLFDSKGIEGDLNPLSYTERRAISERAQRDREVADHAWTHESVGNHAAAIRTWATIFGDHFPSPS